jgi:hypothetical protein
MNIGFADPRVATSSTHRHMLFLLPSSPGTHLIPEQGLRQHANHNTLFQLLPARYNYWLLSFEHGSARG